MTRPGKPGKIVAVAATVVCLGSVLTGCAPRTPAAGPAPGRTAARFADYPVPVIPASVRAAQDIRDLHDLAWRRLQSGDLRGADRDFSAVLQRIPNFYPSETGLGFVRLAGRRYRDAVTHFGAATGRDARYLPAWQGLADAQLALGNDEEAIAALEKVAALDPKRTDVRARVDLLRFRQLQALIETGRKARDAGRLDEAQAVLERALVLSPTSGVIHHELAAVALQRGAHDTAETHARKAIQIDPADAAAFALLGAALEGKGRTREAANAFASAAKIDPRPEWTARSNALREKVDSVAAPAELRGIPTATTVTRAQVAALIGERLDSVLQRAPRRNSIATDVRGHWAESWIHQVTQAGVMDVSPNHTFQPGSAIRRIDLAQVVAQLLTLVSAGRPADLARWKASRPRFVDLPGTNVYYPSAALAVSAGAMKTQDGDRFASTRPATGADVLAAIARVEQLAGR